MKMLFTYLITIIMLLLQSSANAQITDTELVLSTPTGDLSGSFMQSTEHAVGHKSMPKVVALIIAGSGPTDRNGNNPQMTNNSLKMLAQGLAEQGIASLRYDKRGVAKSAKAGLSEIDLRLDTYIEDAQLWVEYIHRQHPNVPIVIVGHSEGALIGAAAAQHPRVAKYVSIAGAGQPIDVILREQLKSQPNIVLSSATPILDSLLKGEKVENVPPFLMALFRPSVQPYMISWFAYDPAKQIAKIDKPVLIVQGTTDIQVSTNNAQILASAAPMAQISIIEGMNHILKSAEADRAANMATYTQADLPLEPKLIDIIANFVK
jgi:pimeloyl-ACP methyl ester carboxylesterase